MKGRRRINGVTALRTAEGWVEGPMQVRRATVDFFKTHFACEEWVRPTLDGVAFTMLNALQNEHLIAPFREDEIEDVVKLSNGSKSPGPDGFNFAFIKALWDVVGCDEI
jgi:predicted outer membrane lipoprotein